MVWLLYDQFFPHHLFRFTYEIAPVFVLMEQITLKKMREIVGWSSKDGDGIFSPGMFLFFPDSPWYLWHGSLGSLRTLNPKWVCGRIMTLKRIFLQYSYPIFVRVKASKNAALYAYYLTEPMPHLYKLTKVVFKSCHTTLVCQQQFDRPEDQWIKIISWLIDCSQNSVSTLNL